MGKQKETEGSTRVCLFSLAHTPCHGGAAHNKLHLPRNTLRHTQRVCVHDDSKSDEVDSGISHHNDHAICKERALPLLPNPIPAVMALFLFCNWVLLLLSVTKGFSLVYLFGY